MTFFSQYVAPVSGLGTLLASDPPPSLEDVLDEAELLQEVFAENPKLLEYLTSDEVLSKLTALVGNPPPAGLELDKQFYYPSLACKVLSCDVSAIVDALMKENHLVTLFAWTCRPAPVHPLLAGFFLQIITVLVYKRSEQIVAFLTKQDDLLKRVMAHASSSAVTEVLKVLVFHAERFPSAGLREWLVEQGLVPLLLESLGNTANVDMHQNIGQLFVEIGSLYADEDVEEDAEVSPLLRAMLAPATAKKLIAEVKMGPSASPKAFAECLQCLCMILELYSAEASQHDLRLAFFDGPPTGPPFVFAALAEETPLFVELLLEPSTPAVPKKTTVGELARPFGPERLLVMNVLARLLRVEAEELLAVQDKIVVGGVVNACLTMMTLYEWSNIMHSTALEVITNALEKAMVLGEETLQFACAGLVEHLLAAVDRNREHTKSTGIRLGNMGFIVELCQLVAEMLLTVPTLADEMDAATSHKWNAFVQTELREIVKLYETPIGEVHDQSAAVTPIDAFPMSSDAVAGGDSGWAAFSAGATDPWAGGGDDTAPNPFGGSGDPFADFGTFDSEGDKKEGFADFENAFGSG